MINPYTGETFFGFFVLFGKRLLHAFSGGLAPDEVQVVVLILIALSSSLVGTFLVLRKMTMVANSLSHTVLLGVVGAFLLVGQGEELFSLSLPTLLVGALIAAFCTTFATEFVHKKLRLQEDASIGLIFTAFFALGVVLVTILARSKHLGIEAIMGNVDALHTSDVKLA
ncbi:MAG: Manganese transport system membrane protein MntB, partial [Chlamydiae bacterium]|nr:Manganese transport system membrane protein MntB [Chlamydiota bacterium]